MSAVIAIVCGGRNYDDHGRVRDVLESIAPTVIITGSARGADRLAGAWARKNTGMLVDVPALWDVYGNRAGPLRNGQMLALLLMMRDNGKSPRVVVVAFPGGTGTADMMKRARAAGVEVVEVES